MSEAKNTIDETLGNAEVNWPLTVKEVNELLNMFNTPIQVPVVTWAKYIDKLQTSVGPQVKHLQDSLEAVLRSNKGANDESSSTT